MAIAALSAAVVLFARHGVPNETPRPAPDANLVAYETSLAASPSAAAAPVRPATAPFLLVMFHDKAVHRDLDQLDPVRGRGYPALRAFIYARGASRKSSPVSNVKPVCHTPTECEYLPPRKSGLPERYTVSIDESGAAELRVDDDEIVIAPRSLAFDERTTVNVTLSVSGAAPVRTRIVYAPPTS